MGRGRAYELALFRPYRPPPSFPSCAQTRDEPEPSTRKGAAVLPIRGGPPAPTKGGTSPEWFQFQGIAAGSGSFPDAPIGVPLFLLLIVKQQERFTGEVKRSFRWGSVAGTVGKRVYRSFKMETGSRRWSGGSR